MGKKHNIVDVDVVFVHQTAKAIGVRLDHDNSEPIWLPAATVEINEDEDPVRGDEINISLPERLAIEKELI